MSKQKAKITDGPPVDENEAKEFLRIVSQALFFPADSRDVFLEREGRENVSVVRVGGSVVGGLTVQPMGMCFGGCVLAMAGVRVVGVAPEHRSSGVGGALMAQAVRDCYEKGQPLSALYPATLSVYRRAGYELAGSRTTYRYGMGVLGRHPREVEVREANSDDRGVLEELYRKRLRRSNGNIERNEWAWQRIVDPAPWWPKTYGYILEQDGNPVGYVYYAHKPGANIVDNMISIADFTWETPEAGRAILSLLADHRSVVVAFEFAGAPADPLTLLLSENALEKITRLDWMLRIVDFQGAVEQRGYPLGQKAELHFEISDDPIVPENEGRWIVSVSDGRATVTRGGEGRMKIGIRDFAPLYSGFFSAESLRSCGRLSADEESITTASHLFSGPTPWMSDSF